MEVAEHRFRVMACAAHVVLVGPAPGAVEFAERRLRQLEDRWSRFLAASDVSRINSAVDVTVEVTADTVTLIRAMQLAHELTGGACDATLFPQLLDAPITAPAGQLASVAISLASSDHTVQDVAVEVGASTVFVPGGLALDPGGIGKGLAADLVVAELLATGTAGALVCVGGDLTLAGRPPTGAVWSVDVEDPSDPDRTIATLGVSAGGVATSSTASRRWTSGGAEHHHVIDPATRRSACTDLVTATVAAPSGWLAEAHAKAGLLRGAAGFVDYATGHDLAGVAITDEGLTIVTPDLCDEIRDERSTA